MNINLEGEFIYITAILMKIKAKKLLPVTSNDDDELIEDPRSDLVERFIEYKKIKDLILELESRYKTHSFLYPRGQKIDVDISEVQSSQEYANMDFFHFR